MKLRTSFFNTAVLKKDITRFAPLWGLYTIFQLLFVLLMWESEGSPAWFFCTAADILPSMGILNFVYAAICALTLFSDLFNARMCNALHAFPMRREGWFLTHLAAGMLFCAGPNLLGAVAASICLQEYCFGAFLWLAVMTLQYLFFFGFAVFSIHCAGNLLGAITVYGLGNFLAVLAAWLVDTFYDPVLFGIRTNIELFARLCPVVTFTDSRYFVVDYDNMTSTAVFEGFDAGSWQYLFVAAAVGLVLLTVALLIYRKRRLETAGDFIAVRPAEPVFLILFTLCVGAVMYLLSEIFSDGGRYAFLVLGFAIGFFVGRMLLERRVKVFRKKSILAFGIFVVAFFGSIFLTWLDPAGITRYVPEPEQVETVYVRPTYSMYSGRSGCWLSDPADIEKVTQVHKYAVENRNTVYENDVPLTLSYTLKNGTTVNREYSIPSDGEQGQILKAFYSRPECVLGMESVDRLLPQMTVLEFYPNFQEDPRIFMAVSADWLSADKYGEENVLQMVCEGGFDENEIAKGLFAAILADCEAGNMSQIWEYHQNVERFGTVTFQTRAGFYWDVSIFKDCTNTVNYIRNLKVNTEG